MRGEQHDKQLRESLAQTDPAGRTLPQLCLPGRSVSFTLIPRLPFGP